MNQPASLPPEAAAKMKRAREIRGLLAIAREQGYRILPDPDRRGICIGFTATGRTHHHLSGTAQELLRREGEVYDHLAALSRLAVAVLEDDEDSPAAAGESPARSGGGAFPEGVPATASDLQGPALPGADRAPSIPLAFPGCPACDPGEPCADHRPEPIPPPMPAWLTVTIAACLFFVSGFVVKVLLFPAVPR